MHKVSDRLILIGVFTSTWGYFRLFGIPLGYILASIGVVLGLLLQRQVLIRLSYPFLYLLILLTITTLLRIAVLPSNSFLNLQSQLIASGSGATREYTRTNWSNLTFNSYFRWSLSIFLGILVCRHLFTRSRMRINTFFIFWHLGISVNVLYAILEKFNVVPNLFVFSTTSIENLRYSGFTVQPNILGSIALLAIPYAFVPIVENRKLGVIMTFIEVMILGYGILICGSRISLALLPIAILIPFWMPYDKKVVRLKRVYVSVILGIFAYFATTFFYPSTTWLSENRFSSENASAIQSTNGRLSLYKGTLQNIITNPIFGYGPAIDKDAHSAYLQVAACLGIQGVIILIWVIAKALFPRNFRTLYKNLWFRATFLATILFWANNVVNNGLTEFYAYFPIIYLIYEDQTMKQLGSIPNYI